MPEDARPPESILVREAGRKPVRYVLRLGMVLNKNPDGSPRLINCPPMDEKIDLAGGEQFVTVYIPEGLDCVNVPTIRP